MGSSKDDKLIIAQLRRLAALGIRVELGPPPRAPQQSIPSVQVPGRILVPTRDINLDLSLLVALCSDITHALVPTSEEDARKRFHALSRRQRHDTDRDSGTPYKPANSRPRSAHEDGTDSVLDLGPEGSLGLSDSNLSQHARSLAAQAMQESRSGLIDEIHVKCYSIPSPSSMTHFDSSTREPEPIYTVRFRFWTTREAKDRFLTIVDKIGGPVEKLRARALFQKDLEANFWEFSRYPTKHIPDLIPIHIHEDRTVLKDPSAFSNSPSEGNTMERTILDHRQPGDAFQIRLRETCLDLLSLGTSLTATSGPTIPMTNRYTDTGTQFDAHKDASSLPSTPSLTPASALKIGPSARSGITPHTLHSLLIGTGAGADYSPMMTTLTANRWSIDTILRRMKAVFPAPLPPPSTALAGAQETHVGAKPLSQISLTAVQQATIWIVEPRSLAEGMRTDSGDVRYST